MFIKQVGTTLWSKKKLIFAGESGLGVFFNQMFAIFLNRIVDVDIVIECFVMNFFFSLQGQRNYLVNCFTH